MSEILLPKLNTKGGHIVFNVTNTQYDVIKKVGELSGYTLTTNEFEEWDMFWNDLGIDNDMLIKMKSFQKINHFPGMYNIAKKNFLAKNLNKMRRTFPSEYNFYPRTWQLP